MAHFPPVKQTVLCEAIVNSKIHMFHIVVYRTSAYFLKSLLGLLKEHVQRRWRCFDFSADERKELT